jgi:hypothetical protein
LVDLERPTETGVDPDLESCVIDFGMDSESCVIDFGMGGKSFKMLDDAFDLEDIVEVGAVSTVA